MMTTTIHPLIRTLVAGTANTKTDDSKTGVVALRWVKSTYTYAHKEIETTETIENTIERPRECIDIQWSQASHTSVTIGHESYGFDHRDQE
jgi:hypothetical protein